jgi:orotate phosphoribosyltransferase
MDNAAEIRHSESDEVFFVDDEMTGGQSFKESAAMLKKQRNSLPVFLSRQTRTARQHICF